VEEAEVQTYCLKGRHPKSLPVAELRRMAKEFKAGHPAFRLKA
jgi:hypothetical protein